MAKRQPALLTAAFASYTLSNAVLEAASCAHASTLQGLPNTGVPQRSMLVQAGGTGTLQLAGGVQQQPLGMQTGESGQWCLQTCGVLAIPVVMEFSLQMGSVLSASVVCWLQCTPKCRHRVEATRPSWLTILHRSLQRQVRRVCDEHTCLCSCNSDCPCRHPKVVNLRHCTALLCLFAVGGAEGLTYTTTAQPQLQAQAGGLDTGYGLVMGGAGNQYSVKPAGGPGVGGMVGGYLQQPLGGAGNMAGLQGLAAAEALRNNNSGVNRGVGLGGSGGMMGLGGAGGSGTRLTAGAGLRGPTSGTVVVSMNNTLGGSGLAGLGSSTGVGPSGPTSSAFGGPTSGAGVTGLGSVSSPGSGTAVGGLLVSPAAQAALDSAGLTMGASAVNTLLGATDAATGGPGSNANVGNSGGLVMVGSTGGAGAGGAGGPDGSSTQVVQVVDAEGQITYHYLQ
jgi:hypothetical protein